MRQLIINIIVFGSIGGLLATMNYPYYTWEFWVIIIGMGIIQINNAIDDQ